MSRRQRYALGGGSLLCLLALLTLTGPSLAQSGLNPTPVVISLTPGGPPGAAPSPTGSSALAPDRFEPNDTPETAVPLGFGLESGLTLVGDDVDYFALYLKAGQLARISTYVYLGLDTRLAVLQAGYLLAENEDRSPLDLGSTVVIMAAADGWYLVRVSKAAVYDGVYDLELLLTAPTATPTPQPSLTPTPTGTPTPSPTPLFPPDPAEPNDSPETAAPLTPGVRSVYTVGGGDVDYFTFVAKAGHRYACETITDQVDTLLTVFAGGRVLAVNDDRAVGRVDSYLSWPMTAEEVVIVKVEARGGSYGQYALLCQALAPLAPPAGPPGSAVAATATATPEATLTATTPVTATGAISLTTAYLGRVLPPPPPAVTHIRLLVYYDANNDRQPGPGEGVANVSVLVVNAQGQPLARVFTNSQGEAVFNLNSEAVSRLVVPFVPGWSARLRPGEINNEIVLGLPAVRLPVFLPVQKRQSE